MIFFDNASTTPISDDALNVLTHSAKYDFFNANALYDKGVAVFNNIEKARENMLKNLKASAFDKFIFTSSATESNNMAILSFAKKNAGKMLFSMSEHPSVYEVAKQLQNTGHNVEFIAVDQNGEIDLDDYCSKLNKSVSFVSIMHINSETGVINDIKKLALLAKNVSKNIVFHSDGVQAVGKIDVNLSDLGVDLYTFSAHKMHGPKGVAALFVKKGCNIKPLLLGGGQEMSLRSGTQNSAAICSFEYVLEHQKKNLEINWKHVVSLKEHLLKKLYEILGDKIVVVGKNTSPYITMILLKNARSETILHILEKDEIYVGLGSACSSKKKENRNLANMNVPLSLHQGSMRISFSALNTTAEVDEFVSKLSDAYTQYIRNTKK